MISQRAIDLIVSCEVSSRATYEKYYRHPEWPGGASGVTIGIGYDLGYASLAKCHGDWQGRVSDDMLRVMDRCLGVHGEAAHKLLPLVRPAIEIPWNVAMAVFLERDVPQWTAAVEAAIPGADKLSPDCLGALVSLAYNRGASFNAADDRYSEMRAIKAHVVSGNLPAVADDIRAMKRLWPSVHGLQVRRDAEAALWEAGLKASAPATDKPIANETPASLPPAPAGAKEHAPAGGAVIATGTAAQQAAQHGWPTWLIVVLVIGGLVIAALIWSAIRAHRAAQPVVARQKDIPNTPPLNAAQ